MSNLKDTLLNFMEFISMRDIYAEGYGERIEAIDKFLHSDFHLTSRVSHPKVKVTLKEWHYKCGDGCCDNYGTSIIINGVEVENQNQDTETIIRKVLEHLGYNAEIQTEYDYD